MYPDPHGIGMIMHAPSSHSIHVLPFQRTPNHEKSIQAPLLFGGGGKRAMREHLSRGGVLGGTVQVVLALATDVAHVGRLRGLGGGLAQASGGGGTVRDIARHVAARVNVNVAGVGRLPVRCDGGLLGKRQVGLSLIDLVGLGLSHLCKVMSAPQFQKERVCGVLDREG